MVAPDVERRDVRQEVRSANILDTSKAGLGDGCGPAPGRNSRGSGLAGDAEEPPREASHEQDQEQVDKALAIAGKLPGLCGIAYWDDSGMWSYRHDLLHAFEPLCATGRKEHERHPNRFVEAVAAGHADDLALLTYTSGTTSKPKGVMISHRWLVDNASRMLSALPLEPGMEYLSYTPLAWITEQLLGVTLGLIAGFLAAWILGERRRYGLLGYLVIGAIGAAWAGLDKLADAGNKEAKRHKENLDALATHKDLASAKGVPVIRSAEPDTADNTKLNVKIALAGHLVSEASFNDILVVSNRLSKSIEALKKVEKHGEQSGNKVVGTTEPSNASGLEKSMADSIASSDPNQARFARDYLKSQNEQALASLEELTRRNQAVIDAMKYFASQVAPQEK